MVDVTIDSTAGTIRRARTCGGGRRGELQTAAATITFSPTVFATSQTITLTQGQLELSNTSGTITIIGPAAGLTVSGGDASRVFEVDPDVTASISGLTIAQGSAASGGGLYNLGVTHLTDCTISGSSAAGNGGGLFNGGTVTLTDCTISGDSAAGGGGLANSGTAELFSCTLSGNSANVGGGIDNLTAATATLDRHDRGRQHRRRRHPQRHRRRQCRRRHRHVRPGRHRRLGGDHGQWGHRPDQPRRTRLAPLGDYGGPTATIALLPGSPAIGAGTVEDGISTDQRGEPLDSPVPDIGAFQSQGFDLTPVTGSTPQSTVIGVAFTNPLAVTVTANNPDEPVAGGVVTFTVIPASSGATANLSGATATIGANGISRRSTPRPTARRILHRRRVGRRRGDGRIRSVQPAPAQLFGSHRPEHHLTAPRA